MTDPGLRQDGLADSVQSALFARRMVLLRGELDEERASQVAASLLTLDATGDTHVELRISSAGGSLDAGLMLVDVIGVLGVPVQAVGLGMISGGPIAVLAASSKRLLARHAQLHLRAPDATVQGRVTEIESTLAEAAARRDLFYSHLATCTGRPIGDVELEWDAGSYLDAEDAITLGYADALES